jgi:DNA-binding CsgD family transcriptional regulator
VKKSDRSQPDPRDADPAMPIVLALIHVVPTSNWSFARINQSGTLISALSSNPEVTSDTLLVELAYEVERQRASVKNGPRIAAAATPSPAYESEITLLFADARADFGVLILRRDATLGLFTSAEVSLLTLALDAASDSLSALRMQLQARIAAGVPRARAPSASPAPKPIPLPPDDGAWYILDLDYEISLGWSSYEARAAKASGLRTAEAIRLPVVIEDCVRSLTRADGLGEPATRYGTARPVPFLVVRTQPMSGRGGSFIGVRIDREYAPNSLADAAARFHISPRELQVLVLLLDGCHLDEISLTLHITSSTVQDHIKSMVSKTQSRNRSELIAHVLGWEFQPTSTA